MSAEKWVRFEHEGWAVAMLMENTPNRRHTIRTREIHITPAGDDSGLTRKAVTSLIDRAEAYWANQQMLHAFDALLDALNVRTAEPE